MIAMITSTRVLAAIADRWEKHGLFESRWSNIVGNWCVNHYRKYNRAPSYKIENIFDRWADGREGKDKETAKMIDKFLSSLSGQYSRQRKRLQVQYVIDLASEHFNSVRAVETCEEVQDLIEDGRIGEAVALMEGFKKVEMGVGSRISVLKDKEAIKRAFTLKSEPLIVYPGALGKFFGTALERDGFISFEGIEKRGKSWILVDIAWQAMTQGRKVAMFQVGDLSEDQIMRRFMARAVGRPLTVTSKDKPVLQPLSLTIRGKDHAAARVIHKNLKFKQPVKWKEAWKACRKITRPWDEDLLQLDTYPNTSISINGIASAIETWKRRDGWVPDVVIIDYADILMPIDGKIDTRHQINATWQGMRALSQRNHCLVVTATQANAAAYEAETLSMRHFSESKTKRAHVTGSIGINQSDAEKKMGVYRFNWIVGREWDYSSDVCVYTAGSLALASPLMLSSF